MWFAGGRDGWRLRSSQRTTCSGTNRKEHQLCQRANAVKLRSTAISSSIQMDDGAARRELQIAS
jgi:hypothetical protein